MTEPVCDGSVTGVVGEFKAKDDLFESNREIKQRQLENVVQLIKSPKFRVGRSRYFVSEAVDWANCPRIFPGFYWCLCNGGSDNRMLGKDDTLKVPTKKAKSAIMKQLVQSLRDAIAAQEGPHLWRYLQGWAPCFVLDWDYSEFTTEGLERLHTLGKTVVEGLEKHLKDVTVQHPLWPESCPGPRHLPISEFRHAYNCRYARLHIMPSLRLRPS
ncbi:hypothetical protein C8J57DRAFT_1227393 [Mycena rebaudengoi]|nr:hypothetical protein C8J57DRAFT_1227393 [Mycena rebaudengoi]